MRYALLILAVSISFSLAGCASLINGTRQNIRVETEPSGAAAKTDSGEMCLTPCTLHLIRRKPHVLTVEKEGYEVVTSSIARSGSMLTFVNVIFPGFLGMAVDYGTGAMFKLRPGEINLALRKK